jgi:hypothetical protein
MSFDWENYVEFQYTPDVGYYSKAEGEADPELVQRNAELKQKVEQTLNELSQTPEGRELLKEAAKNSPDGKVKIVLIDYHPDNMGPQIRGTYPNSVLLYSGEHKGRYLDVHGQYQDAYIQRGLTHELFHLSLKHGEKAEAAGSLWLSEDLEQEAVRKTNQIMNKYYNETDRGSYYEKDKNGTKNLDVNPNFNPDGYAPERPQRYGPPGKAGRRLPYSNPRHEAKREEFQHNGTAIMDTPPTVPPQQTFTPAPAATFTP